MSEKNVDDFVKALYRRRSFNESFWAGIKIACVALSMVRNESLDA